MTTPPLDTNPQRTLADAADRDKANSVGAGVDGFISNLSAAFALQLPSPRDQAIKSQSSVVGIALDDNPSKTLDAALETALELHLKVVEIKRGIREADFQLVRTHYARLHAAASTNPRLHAAASQRLVDGDANATVGLESEADQATRLEAEINVRQQAMSQIGFLQIAPALVIRDAIDGALAKLIDSLQTKDAASAKRYGVETNFSAETRLAVSVRFLLATQTYGLRRLENAVPGAGPFNFQLVRNTFGAFLPEVAAWE